MDKCSSRYAADFGKSFDSYAEWTSGYHELFLRENLADGNWHKIILRHTSDTVYLTVDTASSLTNVSRTIPHGSKEFAVEYVHTGGMKGIKMVSLQESLSQRGIKGCFRNTTMNSISLIDGKDVTLVAAKRAECVSIAHAPMDFPALASYVSFNYTGAYLQIKFGFKTRIVNQSLILYTTGKDSLLTMDLQAAGNIAVQVGGKTIVSPVSGLHNGFWHQLQLSVSDTSPYGVDLTVDGQKTSSKLDNSYLNHGRKVLIGKGYVGCLKDLTINQTAVVAKYVDEYAPNYKLSAEFGRCNLQEYCVPNPCLHGGKCMQTANSFSCDCANTGYTGSTCSECESHSTFIFIIIFLYFI